ncbi:3-deoxy-D-manno-octulosonic acid kinase [Sinimarinibacterium thermocellulolyticum]|uniref:3-deoxy-D-manno-octulosonic acid kinase n=1 Tax=Sinimarinibacterium thermocellulolyticum TaxID=3170016 RepID=A0ABV2A7R9_9GAMM
MQVGSWRHANEFIVYDATLIAAPSPQLFDLNWWQARGAVEASFAGRAKAHVVRHGESRWVLRRYLRGGLVARLSAQSYVWTGLAATRPWREWHLLAALRERGLPVPRPVAAHVRRTLWQYQGHLLSELIADAEPFAELLQAKRLQLADWYAAGAVLRRFHEARVHHPDLNLRNILRGADGRIHLLDFDKGRLDAPSRLLRSELPRLRRSVDKLAGDPAQREAVERGWDALLAGYRGR